MNITKTFAALTIAAVAVSCNQTEWKPVGDRIMTEWGENLDPENVLQEYPRPQMVREDWANLNGMWNYSINGKDMGLIKVPYSAICVGNSTCSLTFNAAETAERSFLCFEGITYRATVTLNGKQLGVMVPYSYYSYEVTDVLKAVSDDEIANRITFLKGHL